MIELKSKDRLLFSATIDFS